MTGYWDIWDDHGKVESTEDKKAENLTEDDARAYLRGTPVELNCYAQERDEGWIIETHDGGII